ncbi:hypothetical protein J3Q64DRAFT_1839959 [Phycomyces blakesleeanus]|uniref:EKC/KEOPS complex subunit GON7 n=2 Tax=Phycomyces blakesleeanus TaxID=4837 RepID=A0A162PQH5_PHYB8|nr:hypothetical protein PHYBLDRAFT_144411 [Phycomyces blakesleeanus NRRL 1555(-)]OAD75057.1 hypothetical protein PHYBLDRAFT_144411 [Phycomyces blakesleeanus NRRL 1555(-)]|eukprot:XP_018293097.1 hypothetical protein PHYBLDRAFT_144411 [Phycomyces blakesleeanus NRRL 1555(-)]
MSSVTAITTSGTDTKKFEATITQESSDSMAGLTAAIIAVQKDINQYLTQRLAAGNMPATADDVVEDEEEEPEEEEEQNEEKTPL